MHPQSTSLLRVCETCQREFRATACNIKRGWGIYCSRKCYHPLPPAARFWTQVTFTPTCWLWTSAIERGVYGQFSINSLTSQQAHVYAYELAYGPIPPGLFVCHHCDVKPCVRPAHHFLGTNSDNLRDAVNKGRMPSGEHNYLARFTNAEARQLRERFAAGGITKTALATETGATAVQIGRLLRWQTYRNA